MNHKRCYFLQLAVFAAALGWIMPAWGQAPETGRRHPEYNLMMGRDAKDVTSPDSPLNPNFIMGPAADRAGVTQSWRSQTISERIVGLTVGDLDGDGRNEVVYATIRGVYVAQVEGSSLKTLATYRAVTGDRLLSVDLYDLNGDGRKEIVVSAQPGRADFEIPFRKRGTAKVGGKHRLVYAGSGNARRPPAFGPARVN